MSDYSVLDGLTFPWGWVRSLQHNSQAVQTRYGGTQVQRLSFSALKHNFMEDTLVSPPVVQKSKYVAITLADIWVHEPLLNL